jgi:hypothetical protein
MLGSVGAVAAAPAESANCIADAATSFAPGTLGPALREEAKAGGLGQFIGGNGGGAAPTNTCN